MAGAILLRWPAGEGEPVSGAAGRRRMDEPRHDGRHERPGAERLESRPWWLALFTLLTLAGAYTGLAWRNGVLLHTSLAFAILNIYTRYFEWFWEPCRSRSPHPRRNLFIVGGIYVSGRAAGRRRVRGGRYGEEAR